MAIDGARKMCSAACLALVTTLALPVGTAQAAPKPSAAEARKKLKQLNDQVDQLVEKYNKARDDLAAAQKKLKAVKTSAAQEQATYAGMRQRVAEMAATAYKSGDMTDVSTFMSASNPQTVLDQVAVFSQLSKNRSSQLGQFLLSAQRLQRQLGQVKESTEEIKGQFSKIKAQQAVLDKAVAKQKALLRQAGGEPSNGGGTIGGTYNGPATGNARAALNYAYAQLGKPYHYGGAGPNSFDCSGLTMMAWRAGGVSLPHNAAAQYNATRHISRENLQPGDLVFFQGLGHVGIAVDKNQMIEAPHTGVNVRLSSISSHGGFLAGGRP
ncbi:NlpC/P60 family protein [Actinomadura scrupuli]|uniref:C40 family peptidase n=1 Tax=Actinomadura scrupuli TaxID=559629 RepID=UPI003D99227F